MDITLESGDADTFLNLLSGAGTDGDVLHYNGDGSASRSRIQETLAAGSYTVEATTYDPGETGSFTLTITVAGDTTAPPAGDCDTDLGALTATVDLAGSWISDCPSTNRPGSHAHYYGFTLGQQTDVTIDLTSARDTIMYLLQGSGRDGDQITFNDDVERANTNSRIIRTLAAGAYTVEAATYTGGQTGDFTLTIAVAEGPGTPPDSGDCLEDLGSPIFGTVGLPGRSWDSECVSGEREGSYAKYFRFTLEREAEVTITLESQDADPYLYLREGEAQSGPYIWENDDHEGSASVSQIQEEIDAGTYTIEATTYDAGQSGSFTLTVTGPPGAQRAALLALYDATGGDNWINNTNWGSNELVREWHGVYTDEQGLVIGLSLGGNGLSGEIPANLDWGAFTRLEWLDLGDNQLTGEIPVELDNLPVLKQLYLNDNRLTGEIPPDLGNQHLTRLALQNNQLTGSIPRQLHRLVSLRILNLGNNQLSGPIPTAFAHHLPRLRLLNLEHNLLSGPIPSVLRHLTDLEVLLLGHNRLNGSIPPALGDLSNLELLRLDNQSPFRGGNSGSSDFRQWLWGPIPQELGNLHNLEELDLGNNRLSGAIPSALGGLNSLLVLDLRDNELDGSIPSALSGLDRDIRLRLFGNRFEECIPAELRDITDSDLGRLGLRFCDESPPVAPAPPVQAPLNHPGDQAALLAFYNATKDSSNWDAIEKADACSFGDREIPLEDWCGVETNDEGRVTEFVLTGHSKNLRGSIPPELGDLRELTILNLSGNRLGDNDANTSDIPTALGDLSKLGTLDLSLNADRGKFGAGAHLGMSGSIPAGLASLSNLTEVYLNGNSLSGSPTAFAGENHCLYRVDISGQRV